MRSYQEGYLLSLGVEPSKLDRMQAKFWNLFFDGLYKAAIDLALRSNSIPEKWSEAAFQTYYEVLNSHSY